MSPQSCYNESLRLFRHEVKTPLTTIYGRAQLLARAVNRSSSLTTEEQRTLLEGLATIEAAVREAVLAVDGLQRRSSLTPSMETRAKH
jgi:signal transduction histidine kinase